MRTRIYAILIALALFVLLLPILGEGGGAYYCKITITEQSGSDLYDYTVKIVLNATNFDGWNYIIDGSDIYFTDVNDNPLYYWIESIDLTAKQAIIWVKVPYIPANGDTVIYMYFGGTNPYPNYNDPYKVFLFYDDFDTLNTTKWFEYIDSPYYVTTVSNSKYIITLDVDPNRAKVYAYIQSNITISTNFSVEAKVSWDFKINEMHLRGSIRIDDNIWLAVKDWSFAYDPCYELYVDGTYYTTDYGTAPVSGEVVLKIVKVGSEIRGYYNDTLVASTTTANGITYVRLFAYSDDEDADVDPWVAFDWVRVRSYVEPEPSITIGPATSAIATLTLEPSTMYLIHDIVYSPNSTQFTHSFTAANTTTAGYETNYTDPYGWRVYANPYEVAGVYYENNASLVSEVNITLPYTQVLVKNVTLLARANGTGSFRQLWIRVLNSTGGVVAELTNATIGTGWTEVSLVVNTSLSGQITIWINATVKSTTTAGEEIGIKDVRVYIEFSTNPTVKAPWSPNVDFFNCSATHYVELGSTAYLNSSVITFKLIEFLIYNDTDYPVKPVYVGNETIGSHNYMVYKIDPANYSQYLTIYALLENKFKTFRTHVKGYDTETVLVGEPLTIELPELGNITIVGLNKTFINVTSVTIKFTEEGTYTIEANLTQPSLWKLGYGRKTVIVKYGAFSVKPIDIDSKVVDYEDLVLQLINKTSGAVIKELIGNQLFSLSNLCAGNYSIVVKFKDIVIGTRDFELNITTDASTINIQCTMKSLMSDYRGLNRTIIYEHGKQLTGVESLSAKYPYSRMRILLNGTGSFKLYINYRGDLPTKVRVVGNVTSLQYYWDGNYLVITGTLGSIGELNITDLYKLRVEIYDRLGNLMPSWIYAFINETKYSGAIVEDYFYPEDYVIKLPKTINGFEFYSFFDGFNETTRAITINNSDVTLKAWYRVPTTVKELKSYKVSMLSWIPFIIEQDNERVKVYIEGYLLDYYGYGVPNRPLTINVTDIELGFTWTINVTTDASGYFRSPLLELVKNRTYRIDVIYNGDDVYVGTTSSTEIKAEELPAAPVVGIPIEYFIIAVAVILIATGIIAATLRAARHTIMDIREKTRRFVKKKK